MQYPVPQFTEVEDKIIGPLTLKQFGILFGAGIIIFLSYSASKSLLVTGMFFVLAGFPALFIAFFKLNGRPLYKTFPIFFKFLTSPKIMIFHKEGSQVSGSTKLVDANLQPKQKQEVMPKETTRTRLQEVGKLLQKQREEEEDLLKR